MRMGFAALSPLVRGVAQSAGGLYRDIIVSIDRSNVDKSQPPVSLVADSPLERGHKASQHPISIVAKGDTSPIHSSLFPII